ncbi:unnamed protein product [Rotaria socialis]|uniref:Uncharacterized protein n=1 Tax=Rotaria socialis TaxID=392032 RepID=A0A820L2G3_9BILA|nr:unnamed protein product [Rotaria socialis]
MSASTIVNIQQNLDRYGLSTLIVMVYDVDHIDPQHRSIVVCKLRYCSVGLSNNYWSISCTAPVAQRKSQMQLTVEALAGYIVCPILSYIYCVAQFYVYMNCSDKFRNNFIRLIRWQPAH